MNLEPVLRDPRQPVDKLCPLPHPFILQKYRKKMKLLNQFVSFSRKCLEGKRERMKMLVILGVSDDFLMICLPDYSSHK